MEDSMDMFSLKGKVIVITGAAGLLGRKHAEVVAKYGANPVLLDLQSDPVDDISKALNEKYGVKSKGYAVDILCTDVEFRYNLIFNLINMGITRIGIADSFIHADIDYNKRHPVIWVY